MTPPPLPGAQSPAPKPEDLRSSVGELLERTAAAVAVADLDGRIVYVNPAFLTLWGFEHADAVLGRDAAEGLWVEPERARAAMRALRSQPVWQGELMACRPSAGPLPVRIFAQLLRDRHGQPSGMLGNFVDISAEHALRTAWEEERHLTELIVGSAGVLVAALDEEGRFVRFNRECERISGWKAEEVLGRPPWETVLPAEIAQAVRMEAFETAISAAESGQTSSYTNEWVSRSGERRLIEWTNRAVVNHGGRRRILITVGTDVTARRAAEQALVHSEARLRAAQTVARMGSWVLDIPTGHLHWSDEVFHLFEVDKTLFPPTYAAFLEGIHPDDRALVDRAYSQSLKTRRPYQIEHRLRMPDGRVKWVEERCETDFGADGVPLRSHGTVQDVTERHQAQEALAASEARLRDALDTYPGWVSCVDDQMRYVYVNSQFARKVGRPARELIGLTADEVLGPDGSAERWRVHERLMAGEPRASAERHLVDASGRERIAWVEYRRSTTGGADGRRLFYAYATDITELRQAERRLAAVTQDIGVGMWELTLTTGAVDFNDELLALAGFVRGDVAGDPMPWLIERVEPADRPLRQATVNDLVEGRVPRAQVQMRVRHKAGHVAWIQEHLRVVSRDSAGRAARIIGVAQDITTLKAREAELETVAAELESRVQRRTLALERAKAEADRANAAKSEFLSHMSHELRTPLNAIIGFGQLLEMSKLPAEDAEHVQEVMRAGKHLLQLIDEILDLATVEAGHVRLRHESVPLAPLVSECTRLMAPVAHDAGVSMAPPDSPSDATVYGDPGRLKQVLLNLLSNAIKYNRRDGRVQVSVWACSHDGVDGWELGVSDTGSGLTGEQMERLFQPFDRLGAERSAVKGTGIGLTLSRRLGELMGGTLSVESQPGKGSTFRLWLPRADAPSGRQAEPAAVAAQSPDTESGPVDRRRRVLYVEDNEANQRLLARLLARRDDIDLRIVPTASEALALAPAWRPALLLIDIQLPDGDGHRLLRDLRERGVPAPALAVSANAMPADVERGRAAGFVGYLTKPLDLQQMLQAIDACIDERWTGTPPA